MELQQVTQRVLESQGFFPAYRILCCFLDTCIAKERKENKLECMVCAPGLPTFAVLLRLEIFTDLLKVATPWVWCLYVSFILIFLRLFLCFMAGEVSLKLEKYEDK